MANRPVKSLVLPTSRCFINSIKLLKALRDFFDSMDMSCDIDGTGGIDGSELLHSLKLMGVVRPSTHCHCLDLLVFMLFSTHVTMFFVMNKNILRRILPRSKQQH